MNLSRREFLSAALSGFLATDMITPFDYWLPRQQHISEQVDFKPVFEHILKSQPTPPERNVRLQILRSRNEWTTPELAKVLNISNEATYQWLQRRTLTGEVSCLERGKLEGGCQFPNRWTIALLPKK